VKLRNNITNIGTIKAQACLIYKNEHQNMVRNLKEQGKEHKSRVRNIKKHGEVP
jgi:predicted metal-dependent phosphoesterase TrpH